MVLVFDNLKEPKTVLNVITTSIESDIEKMRLLFSPNKENDIPFIEAYENYQFQIKENKSRIDFQVYAQCLIEHYDLMWDLMGKSVLADCLDDEKVTLID